MSLSCISLPDEWKKSTLPLCQASVPVFLIVHSAVNRSRESYAVLLAGDCATNSQLVPELWPGICPVAVGRLVAVGVLVLVGMIKIIVAVAVGVSVGVKLGGNVAVDVSAGGGSTSAVCVCAAPAVATTIVWMEPGLEVGFGATGDENGSPGSAHASRTDNTASRMTDVFIECMLMFANQIYLVSKTNCTAQNCVLPTISDHLVEYSFGRFGTSIVTEILTVPPVPTAAGIS